MTLSNKQLNENFTYLIYAFVKSKSRNDENGNSVIKMPKCELGESNGKTFIKSWEHEYLEKPSRADLKSITADQLKDAISFFEGVKRNRPITNLLKYLSTLEARVSALEGTDITLKESIDKIVKVMKSDIDPFCE